MGKYYGNLTSTFQKMYKQIQSIHSVWRSISERIIIFRIWVFLVFLYITYHTFIWRDIFAKPGVPTWLAETPTSDVKARRTHDVGNVPRPEVMLRKSITPPWDRWCNPDMSACVWRMGMDASEFIEGICHNRFHKPIHSNKTSIYLL